MMCYVAKLWALVLPEAAYSSSGRAAAGEWGVHCICTCHSVQEEPLANRLLSAQYISVLGTYWCSVLDTGSVLLSTRY